jgi:hypothetical protein
MAVDPPGSPGYFVLSPPPGKGVAIGGALEKAVLALEYQEVEDSQHLLAGLAAH